MKRSKSLVFQTFLFAGILIFTVLLISFATLYLALPKHYFSIKEKKLDNSVVSLTEIIKGVESDAELASHLSVFAINNNVDVFSFRADGTFIPQLSIPYINFAQTSTDYTYSDDGNEAAFTASPIYDENQVVIFDGGSYIFNSDGGDSYAAAETYDEADAQLELEAELAAGGDIVWKITTSDGLSATMQEGSVVQQVFSTSSNGYMPQMLITEVAVESPFVDTLRIIGTLQPINEAADVILSLLPFVLILSLTIGLGLAYLYSRKISKPVLELSRVAEKMQEMSPDITSNVKSENELGLLSDNLNQLYQKLVGTIGMLEEETVRVRRLERSKTQLIQSASHELKTPIAALKGITEGMIDHVGVYQNRDKYLLESKGQIDRLSRLVQEIILTSQGEGEINLIPEEIHLATLIGAVLHEQEPLILENELDIDSKLSDAIITTDHALLKRSISNLISNAVRYSPKQGTITIELVGDDKGAELTIKNLSQPLSETDLSQITEPFYTPSYSRSKETHGTGLGLYIASKNLETLNLPLTLSYEAEQFIAVISFE